MITYEWLTRLDQRIRDEVVDLVSYAGKYDAEAGFSAVDSSEVTAEGSTYAEQAVAHLIVQIAPDTDRTGADERRLAAYGRLVTATGASTGQLQFVVHPDFRSRGIATTLMEESAIDRVTGAALSHVRAWAYGDHPAADRLSRRFAIPVVDRTWKLVRYLSGKLALGLPPLTFPISDAIELGESAGVAAVVQTISARSGDHDVDALMEYVGRENTQTIVARMQGEPVGVVAFDAAVADVERYPVGRIRALTAIPGADRAAALRALLVSALNVLAQSGAARGEIRLDPDDEALIRIGRLLGFEHEQADVCYRLDRR